MKKVIVTFKNLFENEKHNIKIHNADFDISEMLHNGKYPSLIKINVTINGEYLYNIDAYYKLMIDNCYLEKGIIKHKNKTYHDVYYFCDKNNNVFYFQPILYAY